MRVSNNIINIVASFIILFIAVSHADAQPSTSSGTIDYFQGFHDKPAVIDVLFPEGQAQNFHALPSVNDAFFDTIFPHLSLPRHFTQGEKDTGGRPFYGDPSALDNFKSYDFTGDGQPDILYSGGYAYGEGDMTMLWQNTGNNTYTRIEISRPPYSVSGRILKIVHADRLKPASFLLATYACCAGYIDEFCWYRPGINEEGLHYRVDKKIQLFWGTKFPTARTPSQSVMVKDDKTPLRASPNISDAHDGLRSEIEAMAVYGNILAEFVATSTGVALGQHIDQDGRMWYFVMMDAADYNIGYTRFYDAYDRYFDAHTCGWMEAKDLAIVK